MNLPQIKAHKRDPYNLAEDKYSRSLPLFGMYCGVLVLCRYYYLQHSFTVMYYIFIITFFVAAQYYNSSRFSNYYNTSEYTYKKPSFLFIWFILFLLDSLFAYEQYDIITVNSYQTAYLCSLLYSTALFSLSMSIICLFIKISLFNTSNIRKGLIGIMQRLFIFIRSVGVNKIWIEFLKKDFQTMYPIIIYIGLKGFMMLYMFSDFFTAIKQYFDNKDKLLKRAIPEKHPKRCPVCFEEEYSEPIELDCTHVVCFNCLMQCAAKKALCPMCRTPFRIPVQIEMYNGQIPLLFLLSAF